MKTDLFLDNISKYEKFYPAFLHDRILVQLILVEPLFLN